MEIYNNVKILETDTDKKYFTKHDQYLNLSGKDPISMKLTTVIKEYFTKQQLSSICLQWKDSISEGLKSRLPKTEVRVVHLEVLKQSNLPRWIIQGSHSSEWQRKDAALRNSDFLWT